MVLHGGGELAVDVKPGIWWKQDVKSAKLPEKLQLTSFARL